jgi:hypothetical protein
VQLREFLPHFIDVLPGMLVVKSAYALGTDVEMRFRALAAKGSAARGLRLLDKLDREFRRR